MVEIHGGWRKASGAVSARLVAEAVQHAGLAAPARALANEAWRGTGRGGWARGVPPLRSDAMTVRADDVALRDFAEDRVCRTQHRASGCQPEGLEVGFAVIEVHLVRSEDPTAVRTRPGPDLPE